MEKAQIILKSSSIFTSKDNKIIDGYLAIKDNKIIKISSEPINNDLVDENTKIINLGDKTVSAGFSDAHTFFTGWSMRYIGYNFTNIIDSSQIVSTIKEYAKTLNPNEPIWAHGCTIEMDRALLDNEFNSSFPDRPVVIFSYDGESFYLNDYAIKKYGFDYTANCNEVFFVLLEDILDKHDFSKPLFKKYMKMLNSRGVTMVKEIGYDTFSSFTQVLQELETSDELSLRINFMSQPVKEGANFEYARKMRKQFQGPFVRFSGFNRMTDGSISQREGFLKENYNNTDIKCKIDIDWATIEYEVQQADVENFRFSLNAQGNASVEKVVNIFSKCKKDSNSKLVNRHAITEAEYADPVDLKKMGELGLICEFYPQIQSIADRECKVGMIEEMIGLERGKNYWNRRLMAEYNVPLCCGTDLPLVIDDIPESIFHTVTGKFPEDKEPFNENNTLSVEQVLSAWTSGGAYDMIREDELGTLEEGKLADIAVFSKNIFKTDIEEIRAVKICLTIVDGKIVYSTL